MLPSSYVGFDIGSLMEQEESTRAWDAVFEKLTRRQTCRKRKMPSPTPPPFPPPWGHDEEDDEHGTDRFHGEDQHPDDGDDRRDAGQGSTWMDPGTLILSHAVANEINRIQREINIDREATKALKRLGADDEEDCIDRKHSKYLTGRVLLERGGVV